MFRRVNNKQGNGFLMRQSNFQSESLCLLSDSFSNKCVVDGFDLGGGGRFGRRAF